MSADQISGTGTDEEDWRPWLSQQLAGWPVLDLRDVCAPVVVAPHPDDEVLAAAGLLALTDHPIVIGLSNGEASHPQSPTVTPTDLADRRVRERHEALRRLRKAGNRSPAHIVECHLPDGSLAAHENRITDLLVTHLSPDRWCVAPWQHDGHPDHEAAGRAAAAACLDTGARLLSYPVWAWHWARPADPRVPWARAITLPLSHEISVRKAEAIAAFATQIEPLGDAPEDAAILPARIVARFLRPYEVFFS